MKNAIIFVTSILTITLLFPLVSFAATPSPTPTPNQAITTQIEQQINTLKDKIASKVAQLKLVEKQGIIGTVTDSTSTQITLKDNGGNTHFIDVDELTSFSGLSNKNFGISDVTKNMTIGVLGLYNKESRRILARFITQLQLPTYIRGAVAAIDKTNFTLTVVQNNQSQMVVEIEDITKTTSYDTIAGISKAGFSKIQVGERVYIVGYSDKQNPKDLIASRIILFPSLPINPVIGTTILLSPTPSSTPSATPTSTKSTSTGY